jgi:hypothetical protein
VLKSTDSANSPYTLADSSSSSSKSASSLLSSTCSSSSSTSDSDRHQEHEQAAVAAAWISELLEKELASRELRRAAVREQVSYITTSFIAVYASCLHYVATAIVLRAALDLRPQL